MLTRSLEPCLNPARAKVLFYTMYAILDLTSLCAPWMSYETYFLFFVSLLVKILVDQYYEARDKRAMGDDCVDQSEGNPFMTSTVVKHITDVFHVTLRIRVLCAAPLADIEPSPQIAFLLFMVGLIGALGLRANSL